MKEQCKAPQTPPTDKPGKGLPVKADTILYASREEAPRVYEREETIGKLIKENAKDLMPILEERGYIASLWEDAMPQALAAILDSYAGSVAKRAIELYEQAQHREKE